MTKGEVLRLAEGYYEEVKQEFALDNALEEFNISLINYDNKLGRVVEEMLGEQHEFLIEMLIDLATDGVTVIYDPERRGLSTVKEVVDCLFDND